MEKVLLLEGIHPVAVERIQEEGYEVERLNHSLDEGELIKKLKSFTALGIRSKTQVTSKVLEGAPQLLTVGTFCIGTNQVQLVEANQRGIPVFNAPYSNTRSVAELVLAEIIDLARQMTERSARAHRGEWMKSAQGSHEVRGKTLGIVGYGHIGSQLSVLAEALGLKVLYYDILKKLPLGNANPVSSLKELMEKSHFVSFHVPETNLTKEMISQKELQWMQAGSYLINASRGSVIVIDDLAKALKEGHIAGAAIDVFPTEPSSNSEGFKNPLQGLPNVILTPHIGGSTEEAQQAIGEEVSESLIRYLKFGLTEGAVNFPQVTLPKIEGTQRLLNVHKNIPGVLKEVNSIVSEAGANIRAQALSTDAEIGYLIMDLEEGKAKEVQKHITQLETSIKTRLVN